MGHKHSEETKKKISEANKGKPGSNKGQKHSEETRKKIREKATGRKISTETRIKISKANKGKIRTEETKKRISKGKLGNSWNLGSKRSEETKVKMRNAAKGKKTWKFGIVEKRIICPHCSKEGGNSGMKRWHYDNCKKLKTK